MKKVFIFVMMCLFTMTISKAAEPVGDYLPQNFHMFVNGHIGTYVDKPSGANCDGTVLGGSIVGGYQFSRIVNGGIGMAPAYAELWTKHGGSESYEVPIFAQIRLDNMDKKINPYGEFRIGAVIFEKGSAALYLNTGFGVRIKRFNIGISYTEEINDGHTGYFGGMIGIVI